LHITPHHKLASQTKPQPTNDLESKSAALLAAVFVDFPQNKCNFLHKNNLDIVRRVQFLTGRRPVKGFSLGAVATIAPIWKSAPVPPDATRLSRRVASRRVGDVNWVLLSTETALQMATTAADYSAPVAVRRVAISCLYVCREHISRTTPQD